jgi:hypothetical protein
MLLSELIQKNAPCFREMKLMPLSVEQYRRMYQEGILGPDDKTELLEGYIVGQGRGRGEARPQHAVFPSDAPRWQGLLEIWPLTLAQYQRMIRAGIIQEDDPVELIEGYLIAKDRGRGPGMGAGPEHATAVGRLNRRFILALAYAWVVRCQDPIEVGPLNVPGAASQPEPDLVVADGPDTRYSQKHPGPADIRLLIEVADSSLMGDRRGKAQSYAAAGIRVYWILNVVDRQLEIFTDPDAQAGKYQTQQILTEAEQVVVSWPGLAPVTFAIKDFLL